MKKDMTNIELPRDAAGHEIPLDTKVLYDEDGKEFEVDYFIHSVRQSIPNLKWGVVFTNCRYDYCHQYYLALPDPPDSWEKLEEDLGRTMGKSDAICAYFGCESGDCVACRINKESFKAIPYCNPCLAFKDILDRIRKLRGEGK